jgi:hypothetical protein
MALTTEYEPIPISLINLKSLTVFFDAVEFVAIDFLVFKIIKKGKSSPLHKRREKQQYIFYWSLCRTNKNIYYEKT